MSNTGFPVVQFYTGIVEQTDVNVSGIGRLCCLCELGLREKQRGQCNPGK